jgi:hypothetical protein
MKDDREGTTSTGDRRGVAIVLVLMLILAGGALAHGALLTARGEFSGARSRADGIERAAAERRAVASAVFERDLTGARATAAWDAWLVPDSTADTPVALQRIGPESWWASVPGRRGRQPGSPGYLLWWLDAASRVEALAGVVSVGADAPLMVAGVLDRVGWSTAEPPLTAAICEAEAPSSLDGAMPAQFGLLDSTVVRPSLGLLPFDTLLARTPLWVEGAGTPAPVESVGECVVEDAWNWGDPERSARPCGSHLAVRAAASSLRVAGGAGQGAWVVDGDIVLAEGARLFGFILTSGALVMEGGAVFHGAAVAAGGLRSEAGTRVRGSACWAERALAAAAATWAPRPELVPNLPMITP